MFWFYEQPSDFYRRELFLHEGTHCFMFALLGNAGAPWYKEGLAEYLGTHRWQDGRATLGYMPRSREESPEWGRVRTIQDAVSQRRARRLQAVIDLPPTAHRENEPYAWCWAAVTLLDRHPRYQQRFRQLIGHVRMRSRFQQPLLSAVRARLAGTVRRVAVDGDRHGIRLRRGPLGDRFHAGQTASPDGREITVAADRGWQNSGVRLEKGFNYQLTAAGRYQVAKTTKVWWSEPGGVSIRYYKGRPLGILLAAVRPDHPAPGSTTALLHSTAVGLGTTLSPTETGTLFKISYSAGELDDNAGELKVEVRRD